MRTRLINCGHYPIPVIPGVSIPHGTDAIQPKEENDKLYAESQEQRALERKIRAAKRAVVMAGDTATKEDKDSVKEAQAEMRAFIERTGRKRRYDREQIV
jgi:tRNA uridine 5-carbamoylmethylation protein Kti12